MRLIIVSNRLPISIDEELNIKTSIGGLAKGLDAFLQHYTQELEKEYIWLGWAGVEINQGNHKHIDLELKKLNCYPIDIDNELIEDFYTGFCNKTIWPIFHNLTAYFSYDEKDWQVYKQVNKAFADNILKLAKPDDIIWIHDYHLLLVAQYLREQNPDLTIGSFLHIPFPSFETFQFLPQKCRTEILKGMLGANLLGFHTYEYSQHFTKCVTRMLGYDHTIENIITDDHLVKVEVYPMGIDYEKIQSSLNNNNQQEYDFINLSQNYKIILSIDRLDYTKGIINRLIGYEDFLINNPQWHNKVVLVLIVAPSRESVEHYNIMKKQIDELVGSTNGRFGSVSWKPINYLYKSFDTESLISLYAASDVALITPLMDGMNLIAKEYIAAKTNKAGVLILSESAGAAKELMDALIINPNSKEEISEAIKYALEMPEQEKLQRLKVMQHRIKRYNVIRWGTDFIKDLTVTTGNQQQFISQFITLQQIEIIKQNYTKANSRVLIFDYDGTLVPINKDIKLASPNANLIELLNKLAADNKNKLFIISGRDKNSLENWLGNVNAMLIAEHGAYVKEEGIWRANCVPNEYLKSSVLTILEAFTDRLPGSFIEEKDFSLAWHYRNADPEKAARLAQELLDTLLTSTANTELQVLSGKKVIEVRITGINKGIIGKFILNKDYEFIIAVGDDVTDEDMFRVLPSEAFTIKIGNQSSVARFNINGQDKFISLISDLSCIN